MYLDQMPPEIYATILDNCDFSSLKQLRGVCKYLEAATVSRIFQDAYVAQIRFSVSRLRQISLSPDLAGYVKTLTFNTDRLVYYEDFKDYEASIDLRPRREKLMETCISHPEVRDLLRDDSRNQLMRDAMTGPEFEELRALAQQPLEQERASSPRHTLPRRRLKAYYKRYKHYLDQQEVWSDEIEGSSLQQALGRLPSLRAVEIERSHENRYSTKLPPVWHGIRHEIHPMATVSIFDEDLDLWDDFAVFPYILEALGKRNEQAVQSLTQLKFPITTWSHWFMPDEYDDPEADDITLADGGDPEDNQGNSPTRSLRWLLESANTPQSVQRMKSAFSSLTYLEFSISLNSQSINSLALSFRFLSEFLFEARDSLKDLSIHVGAHTDPWDLTPTSHVYEDFLGYLGHITFPKLDRLTLGIQRTTEESIISFLSRHASTLRHLNITYTSLFPSGGCWSSVIRRLPDVVKLDTVDISWISDETRVDEDGEDHLGDHVIARMEDGAFRAALVGYIRYGGVFPGVNKQEWEKMREVVETEGSYSMMHN